MSDFLANLVGRSLGALNVVQPRVPSLYEPYRRGGGLLGAHPGLHARDTHSNLVSETGPEADDGPASVTPHAQKPGARRILPTSDTRTEPPVEAGSMHDARSGLPTHAVKSRSSERQLALDELDAKPAEGLEPPDVSGAVRPPFTPRSLGRAEPVAATEASQNGPIELKPPPVLQPPTFPPSLSTPKARSAHNNAISVSQAARETDVGRPHAVGSGAAENDGPAAFAGAAGVRMETPGSSLRLGRPTEPPESTGPILAARESSSAGAVAPPAWPTSVAQSLGARTSGMRPPINPRLRSKSPSGASAPYGLGAPDVQVSIGKVEVKAVFPEAPVRLTTPPRSRPTVSLDDYLNRRHRGQR